MTKANGRSEVGDPRHHAAELLADLLGQELQHLHLLELVLGVLAAALGVADVLADLVELFGRGDVAHLHLLALFGREGRAAHDGGIWMHSARSSAGLSRMSGE